MPALLLKLLAPVGTLLLTMGTQLLTEAFLKRAIVIGLRKLVAKTENDTDNQLLDSAIKVWYPEEDFSDELPLSK